MFKDKYSLKIFIFCWLAYTSSYLGRLNYSACLVDIMGDLYITKTLAGAVSTGFLASYGAGQLINGLLGDRVSPKYMIFTGLFGAGICNFLMGINSLPYCLIVIWCLNGFFHSMLWSPIIKCFSEWLSGSNREKAALNISTTIPIGMVISYLISSVCLRFFSWRTNFLFVGLWLVAMSFVWFVGICSMKNEIEHNRIIVMANDNEEKTVIQNSPSLIRVILSTGLLFAVVGIFFNGILKDGVPQWIPTYLTEAYGIASSSAAFSSIIFSVINLSGAYIAAFVNKRTGSNELKTSAIMFIISTSALFLLKVFSGKSLILALVLISLAVSVMHGANTMFLSFMPLRFSKVGKASSVTGFLNACSYISSAVSTLVMGYLAENSGWNTLIMMWVGVSLVGLVICFGGITTWKKKCNIYNEEE